MIAAFPVFRSRALLCLAMALAVALVSLDCTWAAVYYVAPDGLDSQPGSAAEPWATIQKAADTMSAGDTVLVQAGDYASQRVSLTRSGASGAPIVFQAQGAAIMKGFYAANPIDHIHVLGFTICNTDYARWQLAVTAGILARGGWWLIQDNVIHDCSLYGLNLSGNDGVIYNNQLYHNGMAGIEIHGTDHRVENNEIWDTVQCHPTLMAYEDTAPDNPSHLPCPDYPNMGGLDADGMRFFGSGHVIRGNYIHDIPYGPPGLNPGSGDYNVNPHIDCFQTWTGGGVVPANNVLFEQNRCDNCQDQALDEVGQGFMIRMGGGSVPPSNITVRNNVILAYHGMNIIDAENMVVVNNTFIMDLALDTANHPYGLWLRNAPNAVLKNNILFDMNYHTFMLDATTDASAQTGKNLEYRSDGLPLVVNDTYYNATRRAADYWQDYDPRLVDP